MNKYQKFYGSKQVSDLLGQLLAHKLETQPLAKEWYEGLISVLSSLQLQGAAGAIYGKILGTDPVTLGLQAEEIYKRIEELSAEENRSNPFVIDPQKILGAGKNLKMMAQIVIAFTIVGIILAILLACDLDYGTRSSVLGALVIGGVLANILFLGLLYSTGSQLEQSVKRKQNP